MMISEEFSRMPLQAPTTAKAIILAVLIDLPPAPTTIPQINVVLNVGKMIALYYLARAIMKIAQEANVLYRTTYVVLYEHRMVTADLWERRPDKFRDFQAMLQNPIPSPPPDKAKGASTRG
jgi:hypothetical protein